MVENPRGTVEVRADAVAGELRRHGILRFLEQLVNRLSNKLQRPSRCADGNRGCECVLSDLDKLPALLILTHTA